MRRASVRLAAVQLALAAVVGTGLWLSFPGWRLGRINERLRNEYRDLQFITPADLAAWLASEKTAHPLILDVRTPAEFEIGHLIEAHRVTTEGELVPEELPDDHRWSLAVYCSTGERSAAFARRLQRAGFQHVLVLEGGIVRWANEEHPMTNGRELVTRVHPGDLKTVPLLKSAHRAALPAAP